MASKLLKRYADIIGTVSAGLCLVHCMTVPLLLAMAVVIPDLQHGYWHLLHYLFTGLALLAVRYSTSRYHVKKVNRMMWLALIIFSLALFLHEVFPGMIIVSASASLILMTLHMVSRNRSQKQQ